jgi:hypothetical protein
MGTVASSVEIMISSVELMKSSVRIEPVPAES